MGWERWTGDSGAIIGVNRYGASAPVEKVYCEYGLTVENILKQAATLLK
jgi:transketolase